MKKHKIGLFIWCVCLIMPSFAQNVGLGILSPQSKLHIKGSDNISQLIIDANTTQSNTQPLILLRKASGNNLLSIHSDDSTNVFIGLNAGRVNAPSGASGTHNTFLGSLAGYTNTSGNYNTTVGSQTLYFNTTGHSNTAMGFQALLKNVGGQSNTAIGYNAMFNNVNGSSNTAVGTYANNLNTSGGQNASLGVQALYGNTTGWNNVAIGMQAQHGNTTGWDNVAIGMQALQSNISSFNNTAVGTKALRFNTSFDNTAVGSSALYNNTTGNKNTAVSAFSLYSNTTGNKNTSVGDSSLYSNTTGNNNTAIGYKANVAAGTINNATAIGSQAYAEASNSVVIGSINGINGATASANVGIGTSTPNASSVLELNSTTKGFLPPRMTAEQRDAIVSPAAGLFIWCTNCAVFGAPQIYNGLYWTTLITPDVIGQPYQGGRIAYVLQPGDPGYDPNVPHGLIAANFDYPDDIPWWNGTFILTGAAGTALGTGQSNTTTIVTSQGVGTYPAKICDDMVLNGYSDWYLPSKDELNKLYLNRVAIGSFYGSYWSSSESDNTYAYYQNFENGAASQIPKNASFKFRAVRAF